MNFIRKIFGALAVLIGGSIIVWVLFNVLVERQPQFNWQWWKGFGIGIPFVATGWYWLRTPVGHRNEENEFEDEEETNQSPPGPPSLEESIKAISKGKSP